MANQGWLDILREDVKMFNLAHSRPGFFKYFYHPGFRAMFIFRLSQLFYKFRPTRPIAYVMTVLNDFLTGVWIGPKVTIGQGLFLGHPRGLVVNPDTKIGNYCSILQRVTLGGPNIVIGDYVEINAGAQLISNERGRCSLHVGSNVIIGAGALVLKDIPDFSVVAGVPAKVIKTIHKNENWVEFRKNWNANKSRPVVNNEK